MGFRYKARDINLGNYLSVFKGYSPDVLDEIRSAILDDTQIAKFIEPCANDSYKLGQLRMAVREYVPVEYLSTYVTGKTIYYVRKGLAKGLDMTQLLRYINVEDGLPKLEPSTIETLAEFVYLGTHIDKVDFNNVRKDLVKIVCKGLVKGYPMWLCISEGIKDEDTIKALMRGMQLGIDIHPFVNGDWSKTQLYLLFSYSKVVDLNIFLGYITSKFSENILVCLLQLMEKGIDIKKLCVKDNDGYCVYNQYQIYEIGKSMELNAFSEEMLNASLSDMDIISMRESIIEDKNKLLSISLGKKV